MLNLYMLYSNTIKLVCYMHRLCRGEMNDLGLIKVNCPVNILSDYLVGKNFMIHVFLFNCYINPFM